MLAAQRREHMAVVFQIIADDQRRPVFAVTPAADPLPGAKSLDPRAVAQLDRAGAPYRPATACARIFGGQLWIVGQFALEVIEVGAGLMARVGHDPNISLPAFHGGPQGVGQGGQRRFGAATRAKYIQLETPAVGHRVQSSREPAVHCRRRFREMLGQVTPTPGQQRQRADASRRQSSGRAVLPRQRAVEFTHQFAQPRRFRPFAERGGLTTHHHGRLLPRGFRRSIRFWPATAEAA